MKVRKDKPMSKYKKVNVTENGNTGYSRVAYDGLVDQLTSLVNAVNVVQPMNQSPDFLLGQLEVVQLELNVAKEIVVAQIPLIKDEIADLNEQTEHLKIVKQEIIDILAGVWDTELESD